MKRVSRPGPMRLAVLIALVLAAWLPGAEAGKGGNKPGGGGGQTPAGVVYYTSAGLTWTMDAGGGGKTALPANVFGEPSHALHGGFRWWLQARTTSDGWQLFAVRGDGDEGATVRLTTDPSLELRTRASTHLTAPVLIRWSKDDTFVSWVGLRWAGSTPVDPGIYAAAVVWDGSGSATGLAEQPSTPAIDLPLRYGDLQHPVFPDGGAHDWSPDGSKVVYGLDYLAGVRPYEIHVGNPLTGQSDLLATQAGGPRWSPDGSRIAFGRTGDGDLYTIRPDGTDETLILATRGGGKKILNLGAPRWAPTSAHLIYHQGPLNLGYNDERDVWRATDAGRGAANLTEDLEQAAHPVAWR